MQWRKKELGPPEDQDTHVIEITIETEFRKFLSLINREHSNWCKTHVYKDFRNNRPGYSLPKVPFLTCY